MAQFFKFLSQIFERAPLQGARAAGWTAVIFNRHDAPAGQLIVLGQTFRRGESAHEQSEEHGDEHDRGGKGRSDRTHHGRDDHHDNQDRVGWNLILKFKRP